MANRAIYERVRDAGGTLYPVSAFPMSRDDWRRHFGAAFDQLSDAKHDTTRAGAHPRIRGLLTESSDGR